MGPGSVRLECDAAADMVVSSTKARPMPLRFAHERTVAERRPLLHLCDRCAIRVRPSYLDHYGGIHATRPAEMPGKKINIEVRQTETALHSSTS
jgi:hypothetical protein